MTTQPRDKVKFNPDNKFDLQLDQALINERRLGDIFAAKKIEKIELKSETWLWERTGNICIECKQNGQPSGISITEADYWVHELRRDDDTLCYLMFPTERLKRLAQEHGRYHEGGGDGGRFSMYLLRLADILK